MKVSIQDARPADVKPRVRRRPWEKTEAHVKPEFEVANSSFWDQSVLSPLRYPGAKRQLVPLIEELIRTNALSPPRLLVEPFCGGATTSLRAVGSGAVEHVVLADANPLVAAFWYTAAFDTGWLVNAMMAEEVTLDRWDWWRAASPKGRRDRALKCLFLNRTSFSGIIDAHAGALGGRAQTSKYKIDCRFGKDGLATRIRAIGDLGDTGRILDVWNCHWRESLIRTRHRYRELGEDRILIYLDPPYVEKADSLYGWSFDQGQHQQLASALADADGFNWILSYGDHPTIRALYENHVGLHRLLVPHRYTASGGGTRVTKNELFLTTYRNLPDSERFEMLEPTPRSWQLSPVESTERRGSKQ